MILRTLRKKEKEVIALIIEMSVNISSSQYSRILTDADAAYIVSKGININDSDSFY